MKKICFFKIIVGGCMGCYSVFSSAEQGNKSIIKDEMTITANKIEEKLLDVPQSITVIDAKTIEQKGIRTIKALIDEVPNMTVSPSSGSGQTDDINFRGLGVSIFTNSNPIIVYIDGIASNLRYGMDAPLSNVERVEVLRGPQGTLYGKDAIGGVINIVTKKPTNSWQTHLTSEYASRNYLYGLFNSSGALVKDKLYLGVSGQGHTDDGWIKNNYQNRPKKANNHDQIKLSSYLLYQPIEQFDAKFVFSHMKHHKNWFNGYSYNGNQYNQIKRKSDVSYDSDYYGDTTDNSQSLILNYHFDKMKLSSVTTHKRFDVKGRMDVDKADYPAYLGMYNFDNQIFRTLSQEIRVSNNTVGNIRWVAGIYLDREKNTQGPYGMQYIPKNKTDKFEANSMAESKNHTQAVFGQMMIPFLKRLELTLGSRYQHIKKDTVAGMYGRNISLNSREQHMFTMNGNKKWNAFLPKIALNYKISPKWMTYTSYSKGYTPGGFNYWPVSTNSDENRFKPQITDNYEIGLKTDHNNFNAAATLFWIDIKDIHIYKFLGNDIFLADNAKKAVSKGAELEVRYRPISSLELNAAFGYTHAKYKDYDIGYAKFDHFYVDRMPKYTAQAGVAYTDPLGLYSRFDIRHRGSMPIINGSQTAKIKGHTIADVKLGYLYQEWDFYGYVKNITDEKKAHDFIGSSAAMFGEPRKFGAGVSYKF